MIMQEKDAREQMEVMIKEKAESDVLLGTLKERVNALKDEVERMRRQIHELQQESADKEVKVMQLTKQRSQDKEDLNGLNIALDSKQQELELLKRKAGMRGTAGSTPAQPSKIQPRSRESAPFSTPSTSRPSSALSDVSKDGLKERKVSDPPSAIARPGLSALSKSARMNAASGSKVAGSMGPPPAKFSRPSLSGTPTPASTKLPSSLLRSTTVRSGPSTPTASTMRKTSGSSLNQSQKFQAGVRRFSAASTPSEQDEKENMDDTPAGPTKSMRRTNLVPA
ncbi:hypothetical protein SERLADRAFT_477927 [Serpula lacrymans var. lacrymans S7.9]|uniref:Uncharacterized protein n=1 Tax=Serpula lacrymans var. lacrymans (strain S7.9) TaxID=578457 RepID=F8P9Q9_SERL9|nr:uncharacterized protein SERLADRAFT_477927 [Serpula lacrymans var. lacrymans S7.9]EGO20388.1 hypothetical protein SERLADRAFT_477927 [Serpula lacrymans var. lacrymans S7.9]